MKMQPVVAGEPWTVLATLIVEFDDGDGPSSMPCAIEERSYDLDEHQQARSQPLVRALLRTQASLLVAEAARPAGRRGPQLLDSESLPERAAERLFVDVMAALVDWASTSWFPRCDPDLGTVAKLAVPLLEIEAREDRRRQELERHIEEILGHPFGRAADARSAV